MMQHLVLAQTDPVSVSFNWQAVLPYVLLAAGVLWAVIANGGSIAAAVRRILSPGGDEIPKPPVAVPGTSDAPATNTTDAGSSSVKRQVIVLDSDATPSAETLQWVKDVSEAAGDSDTVFREAITNGESVVATLRRRVRAMEAERAATDEPSLRARKDKGGDS